MSDQSYAVELQQVVKKFGNVTAVNNVTLQIKDGEFFSLLGPSGCGKTTSLRMIAGFEMPTSGDVLIAGEPQGYLPAFKRPVNTVFQHYALFPHMSVYENVAFGLEMKKESEADIKQRVGEALDLVHLTGLEKRRPKQLSGGQQQRVALARALVNKPKVLLLDEPLGALDLKLRKAMQVELKKLQEQIGITFVYVTHDQEEALTMSDRIGVMSQGDLLQVGSPLEVYEHPKTMFVSDFIGETNYISGKIESIENQSATISFEGEATVRAEVGPGFSAGDKVSFAIRPEKVRIGQPFSDFPNHIQGKVVDIVYLGLASNYYIELPGGEVVLARRQNTDNPSDMIPVGEMTDLAWTTTCGNVFPKGAA